MVPKVLSGRLTTAGRVPSGFEDACLTSAWVPSVFQPLEEANSFTPVNLLIL